MGGGHLVLVVEALPKHFPVLVVVVVGGDFYVGELFDHGGRFGVVALEVLLARPFAGRDEAPFLVTHHFLAKLGEGHVVSLQLLAGVDVVVVVVVQAVGVVPGLEAFRPVLGAVARGVAALGPAEHDPHLVFPIHLHLGIGRLAVDQHVALVEAFLQQFRRFLGESFFQGAQQGNFFVALHPAEALGGPPVVPDAEFVGFLEGRGQALLLILVEARPVHHVAELVDEDAFQGHAALVFHYVFLGEKHHRTLPDPPQEAALAPIVEVQLLARFVAAELGQLGSQFVMPDQYAEQPALAYALGHRVVDALHHLAEQVGRFRVGVVRHLARGGDQYAVHLRPLFVELDVQLVGLGLRCAQRLGLVLGEGGAVEQSSEK